MGQLLVHLRDTYWAIVPVSCPWNFYKYLVLVNCRVVWIVLFAPAPRITGAQHRKALQFEYSPITKRKKSIGSYLRIASLVHNKDKRQKEKTYSSRIYIGSK